MAFPQQKQTHLDLHHYSAYKSQHSLFYGAFSIKTCTGAMKQNGAAPVLQGNLPRSALRGGASKAPALCEKQLWPLSQSRLWLHSGYFQPLEITRSWFSSTSLPECLFTLHKPMLVWVIWEWRVWKAASLLSLFSKYVLLSLCMVSVVTLWGEDKWNCLQDGIGTDDSRVIMTSRQAAQGLLWFHACHLLKGHHKRCFVSVTQPRLSGSHST